MTITLNATTGISTPPVSVLGDTSGSITFAAPAVAGTNTQTLVAVTGTLAPIVSGTAQASTSGTAIDFTGIPSWVKRITVMMNGVSTNGTSNLLIQLGTGAGPTFVTSGYVSSTAAIATTSAGQGSSTVGFGIAHSSATQTKSGAVQIVNITGNDWCAFGATSDTTQANYISGAVSLGAVLTAVRITSVTPNTFDAGTINILYE
jgi:hypothetical protein